VSKKLFSTGTAIGGVFLAGISEQGSSGGGDHSSAIRLAYLWQTRHTHDQ
jgi:hypothetical protein